jgi:Leucine-rich repeat (LRR) protein
VQPFEPYWEELRSIDLRGKGVDSVARLKEFLPKLEEIKLYVEATIMVVQLEHHADNSHRNQNAISYLSGIPSSVRTLHVPSNRLTSLTSVNHLRNLQYLDISRNQLDSVSRELLSTLCSLMSGLPQEALGRIQLTHRRTVMPRTSSRA